MCPVKKASSAPPTEPAIPPIPTTAPTALFGNISETVVKRLADQPWWAPAATLRRPIAAHSEVMLPRVKIGTTMHAQKSMAESRAPVADNPSLRNGVGSQPPPMLPIADML